MISLFTPRSEYELGMSKKITPKTLFFTGFFITNKFLRLWFVVFWSHFIPPVNFFGKEKRRTSKVFEPTLVQRSRDKRCFRHYPFWSDVGMVSITMTRAMIHSTKMPITTWPHVASPQIAAYPVNRFVHTRIMNAQTARYSSIRRLCRRSAP